MAKISQDLKLLLHPYIFVLKEGRKINNDFLDYSLLMLQVTCPETIHSPQGDGLHQYPPLSESDILKAYIAVPPQ